MISGNSPSPWSWHRRYFISVFLFSSFGIGTRWSFYRDWLPNGWSRGRGLRISYAMHMSLWAAVVATAPAAAERAVAFVTSTRHDQVFAPCTDHTKTSIQLLISLLDQRSQKYLKKKHTPQCSARTYMPIDAFLQTQENDQYPIRNILVLPRIHDFDPHSGRSKSAGRLIDRTENMIDMYPPK